MSLEKLDFIFPFVVFFYGFFVLVVYEIFYKSRYSHWLIGIRSRIGFAWLCFFVGGLWSVQNLWG